jgi:hypothetical protein
VGKRHVRDRIKKQNGNWRPEKGRADIEYAGLAMEEGLQQIHGSLQRLEKRGQQ